MNARSNMNMSDVESNQSQKEVLDRFFETRKALAPALSRQGSVS